MSVHAAVFVMCLCTSRLLLLWVYQRRPSVAVLVAAVVAVTSIVASLVYTAQEDMYTLTVNTKHGDYWTYVYVKPWFRIFPYMFGILLGIAWVTQKTQIMKLFTTGTGEHMRLHVTRACSIINQWLLLFCVQELRIGCQCCSHLALQ